MFSRSVADSIRFLRLAGYPQFADSKATEEFIRLINDLFDIFNSRSTRAACYKKPLSATTVFKSFTRLDEGFSYLKGMRTAQNVPLTHIRKKTGIIGFLLDILSLKKLYTRHLAHRASFFCGYRLCQDHIELLFNCIRR